MRLYSDTLLSIEKLFGSFTINIEDTGVGVSYIRFGYWIKVDVEKLQSVIGSDFTIVEDSIEDEDTGWNYYYKLT